MKLRIKREALAQLNRRANDKGGSDTAWSKTAIFEPGPGLRSAVFSGSFLEPPAGIEPATC